MHYYHDLLIIIAAVAVIAITIAVVDNLMQRRRIKRMLQMRKYRKLGDGKTQKGTTK